MGLYIWRDVVLFNSLSLSLSLSPGLLLVVLAGVHGVAPRAAHALVRVAAVVVVAEAYDIIIIIIIIMMIITIIMLILSLLVVVVLLSMIQIIAK